MIWSRIVGTGSYLPPKVVTNADLARQMDTSDEWIRTRTGIRQRHIAEPSQTSSDLAVEASRQKLQQAQAPASPADLTAARLDLAKAQLELESLNAGSEPASGDE